MFLIKLYVTHQRVLQCSSQHSSDTSLTLATKIMNHFCQIRRRVKTVIESHTRIEEKQWQIFAYKLRTSNYIFSDQVREVTQLRVFITKIHKICKSFEKWKKKSETSTFFWLEFNNLSLTRSELWIVQRGTSHRELLLINRKPHKCRRINSCSRRRKSHRLIQSWGEETVIKNSQQRARVQSLKSFSTKSHQ